MARSLNMALADVQTSVHFRNRSVECFALAECMADPGAKATMLKLAVDYQAMADNVELLEVALKEAGFTFKTFGRKWP